MRLTSKVAEMLSQTAATTAEQTAGQAAGQAEGQEEDATTATDVMDTTDGQEQGKPSRARPGRVGT